MTEIHRLHDAIASPDFRMISTPRASFAFTARQASVVETLWAAADAGVPVVGDAYLLDRADSDAAELRALFRTHEAWGTLILPGPTRGSRQLNVEELRRENSGFTPHDQKREA